MEATCEPWFLSRSALVPVLSRLTFPVATDAARITTTIDAPSTLPLVTIFLEFTFEFLPF
jgi:hypothetical protein